MVTNGITELRICLDALEAVTKTHEETIKTHENTIKHLTSKNQMLIESLEHWNIRADEIIKQYPNLCAPYLGHHKINLLDKVIEAQHKKIVNMKAPDSTEASVAEWNKNAAMTSFGCTRSHPHEDMNETCKLKAKLAESIAKSVAMETFVAEITELVTKFNSK